MPVGAFSTEFLVRIRPSDTTRPYLLCSTVLGILVPLGIGWVFHHESSMELGDGF